MKSNKTDLRLSLNDETFFCGICNMIKQNDLNAPILVNINVFEFECAVFSFN